MSVPPDKLMELMRGSQAAAGAPTPNEKEEPAREILTTQLTLMQKKLWLQVKKKQIIFIIDIREDLVV